MPSWRANADCDGPCSVRYLITRTAASAVRFIFGLDFRVTQVLGVYLLGAVQPRTRRNGGPRPLLPHRLHERMIREVTSKHHHIVFLVSREPSARRPALRPGKAFPAQRDQDAATSRKPRRTTPIKRPRHRNRSPLDRYATSMSLESLPPWAGTRVTQAK